MNNRALINKFGEPITLNGVSTKAYFEDSVKTIYLNGVYKQFTSFDFEVIHTAQDVTVDDALVLRGENFGVIEAKPVYTGGSLSYCEAHCFLDDFINDITIKKQSLNTAGCNLPNVSAVAPIITKARIKTAKPMDYLEFALQGAKVPTHIFVLKYIAGIGAGDLIEFGNRRFEVLAIENINEKNKLLAIDCIEVLNV